KKLAKQHDNSAFNNFPLNLPLEIHAHILSFLSQRDLLRAGLVCRTWRHAAEIRWKTEPLNLSHRALMRKDYKAIARGPFCSLILQKRKLGKEEVRLLLQSSKFTSLDLRW